MLTGQLRGKTWNNSDRFFEKSSFCLLFNRDYIHFLCIRRYLNQKNESFNCHAAYCFVWKRQGSGRNDTAIHIRGVVKFKENLFSTTNNYFSTTNKNRIFGRFGYGTEPEVTGGSRSFEIRPGSHQRKDEPEADKSSEYTQECNMDCLFEFFFVPLENSSLIWKRYSPMKCSKFWPILGTCGHWAVRVLYRVTQYVLFKSFSEDRDIEPRSEANALNYWLDRVG